MTSTVVYEGGLRTTNTHLKSGSSFETDAPVDNHGKGDRFSPTDLLATSLANCMVTTMAIKANSMDYDIPGIRIEVLKIMRSDPRRVAGIELKVHIPETLDHISEKDRTILKNTGLTCPVQRSLHPDVEVKVDWGVWS
ncbi:MAG: OsmC family protein [Chitinophagaceae bacterium]|nr:OsmC family protein [Chitinophagaceae bacterium]